MAKFSSEIPNELFHQLERFSVKDMMSEMVAEAGKAVLNNMRDNMHKVFKTTKSLDKGLKMTKVYKTSSDDGINVAIGFYGYDTEKISEKYPKGKPIPLIAMAREYGTSSGEKKRPFMRKSFKKAEIEAIMQKVQDKYIGGDD